MCYVDTSVILAFHRAETASGRAQALLDGLKGPALISSLTEVEFASALARWVRTAEVREADASRLHAAFQSDLDNGCYQVIALTAAHYRQATVWLLARRAALRTLDALHLACAAKRQVPLATFDRSMQSAAAAFGVAVQRF
jgi:predicted nucleic acid-binding protein